MKWSSTIKLTEDNLKEIIEEYINTNKLRFGNVSIESVKFNTKNEYYGNGYGEGTRTIFDGAEVVVTQER